MSVVPRDVFEPLPADWREQLEARWPDAERLRWAWRLARDVETCADLIAGRAIGPARLDQEQLRLACSQPLVRLDARPADFFEGIAA